VKKVENSIKEEMGGILVYDSYAQLVGCEKIEKYWANNSL
jgi:hypothetical protein